MKNLFILVLPLCFSLLSFGQTPKTISYQGVARNSTGQPIPNQSIKIKLSLLETATRCKSLFVEIHTHFNKISSKVQTNEYDVFGIIKSKIKKQNKFDDFKYLRPNQIV